MTTSSCLPTTTCAILWRTFPQAASLSRTSSSYSLQSYWDTAAKSANTSRRVVNYTSGLKIYKLCSSSKISTLPSPQKSESHSSVKKSKTPWGPIRLSWTKKCSKISFWSEDYRTKICSWLVHQASESFEHQLLKNLGLSSQEFRVRSRLTSLFLRTINLRIRCARLI